MPWGSVSTRSYPLAAATKASAMPVLPDVASTIVVRPGSMRPSASAASIIATPILSFTLPAGLYASSLPISSAPLSGAGRVRRTIGVPPTRSARLDGMLVAVRGFATNQRVSAGRALAPGAGEVAAPRLHQHGLLAHLVAYRHGALGHLRQRAVAT